MNTSSDEIWDKTFFNRLYKNKSSPDILSPYRRRDPRDSAQKEYDSYCTFRPVINGESPFISERTIRSTKLKGENIITQPRLIQRDGEISSTLPYRSVKQIKDSYNGSQISSGLYKKEDGFIPGLPVEAGLPLYYFNPAFPPPFNLGYCIPSSSADDADLKDATIGKLHQGPSTGKLAPAQSNELAPPPLPPWAFGPRSGSDGASQDAQPKKVTIVITKKEKKEEPAAAEGGWKALLAELQKRTSGLSTGLKKPVEVKPAPAPQKKKKKSKKKQEFKDVMEEMRYKLAKRNGEIVEEDDDDEEEEGGGAQEAKAAPPPPPPLPKPEGASETPSINIAPSGDESNKKNSVEGKEKLRISTDSNDLSEKGDPFSASTDSVGAPLSSASTKSKKLLSKPDLSSILAKVKPPAEVTAKVTAPAVEEKKQESNSEEAPTKNKAAAALNKLFSSRAPPTTVAPSPSEPKPVASILSAPKLASSPPPPPPPVPTSWPPIPVITADLPQKQPPRSSAGENIAQDESRNLSQPQTQRTVQTSQSSGTMQAPLPEGYYLEQPEENMVEPGRYTRAGWTTLELCASMQRSRRHMPHPTTSSRLDSNAGPEITGHELINRSSLTMHPPHVLPDSELGVAYDGFESQHKQLAISDLPLPGNFYQSVEHMRKGKELRLAQKEKLRQLELRNFLSDPIPTMNSAKESIKPLAARSTAPVQFVSHVDLHYENKAFSFRKPVESTNRSEFSDGSPMSGARRANLTGNMYTPSGDVISNVNPATLAWMNDLRGTPTASQNLNTSRMTKENNRSSHSFNDRSEYALHDDNVSTRNAIDYFAKASRKEMMNSGRAHTGTDTNSSSKPSGKKLLVDDLIDRRNLIREERRKMEAEAEAERVKAEKMRKAWLKDRALRNTHTKPQLHYLTEGISPIVSNLGGASLQDHSRHSSSGSVSNNSNTNQQRFAYHKKLIDKYKNTTGSVDLEHMAASAYTEYSIKHLNKKSDYIYSSTPLLRTNTAGPLAADVYRDLEREFEEYDDGNINTFRFIDR